MNKDSFQDKYNEIFQEIKEEKMDWNFEDFLKKTEEKPEETKIIPLQKKIWWWQSKMVLDGSKFGYAIWNDDVF